MKHPVLCLFMVCVFSVATTQPFVNLNAAELWNSKANNAKPKGVIFNNSRTSNKKSGVLYNSQSKASNRDRVSGVRLSSIRPQKKVSMSAQKPSRLWGLLDPLTLKNKQDDIDTALQQEYDVRKNTSKLIAKMLKEDEIFRIKAKRAHQERWAKYKADKEAARQAKLENKLKALGRWTSKSKRVYRAPSGKVDKNTGMRKPKRLFNDPNK